MKRIIFALIAILLSTQLYPTSTNTPQTSPELHSEVLVEDAVKDSPEPKKAVETPVEPQIDPNGCEPEQFWAKEPPHECIDKPKTITASTVVPTISGCENFRAVTAKYFPADQVDNALFVFSKESGCRHPTPLNATNDSGLCQLHNEYIADLDAHVKRCADKYYGGRIGSNNWSAWYAVCKPNPQGIMLTPIQLYPNIHCS